MKRARATIRLFRPAAFALVTIASVLALEGVVHACKTAVITPEKSELANKIGPIVQSALSEKCEIVDPSLAAAAFDSQKFSQPYNLSNEEARNFSAAAGIDAFVLLRSAVQRRSSFEFGEAFEAYAISFLVDGVSGRLINWKLITETSQEAEESVRKLMDAAPTLFQSLAHELDGNSLGKTNPVIGRDEYVFVDADDPGSKLRAPAPYKRLSPRYNDFARLYGIEGTVEMFVYIDRNGKTKHLDITRWAGFGLEESVGSTLLEMNWRPAQRNGVPIPSRILVKYNFKKLTK